MSYLLKSSNFDDRRKAIRKKIFGVVILIIIILIIIGSSPARGVLFFVAEPFWQLENSILNSRLGEYFKSKQTLIAEKIALEQRLFLTGNLQATNDTLQAENDNLKDLLGRKDIKLNTVLASILVRPPQLPYDTLIVDLGAEDNIMVGDKIVANANVYIGEVSEILPHSSKVTLYSTPGQKLSVVLGASSVTAEAVGIGGGNFSINLPKEVEVKEGDVIVIPSITPNVFGIVEKVNFKETDSFQVVLFKSPINISELSWVEIVLGK